MKEDIWNRKVKEPGETKGFEQEAAEELGQDKTRVLWSRFLTSQRRKLNLFSVSRNNSLFPAEVRGSWEASSELLGLVGEHMLGRGAQRQRVDHFLSSTCLFFR